MRMLVIGGARFSGRALCGLALDAGHEVTMFHRGTGPEDPWPAAEHVHGDRHEGFGDLAGRSFDAVVDTCAFVPRDVEEAADAFGDAGLALFVSSLSAHIDDVRAGATEDDDVYGPPFPETEEVTYETYGPLKVASEQALRARYGDRALVVRPGYIVGPHDPTDRFTYWVRRAARGGEMLAPGPPEGPMQWIDARDLAAFMLALCERGVSGTFNVVTPPGRHTAGGLLELARAEAGADTTFAWIDRAFAEEQGLLEDEDGDPMPMWTPQLPGFELFDTSRAQRAGLICRPLVETVRDTLRWDAERGAPWPMRAGLDDARERELLAAWHAAAPVESGGP
ncbi:MAG TPA: NAD-dependent epimerase/dehydratase family protein [Actinomycetota bacterium]|nr:NAD-dependent epimerase/dehydratase family protein [Actinomycetota bacterium]